MTECERQPLADRTAYRVVVRDLELEAPVPAVMKKLALQKDREADATARRAGQWKRAGRDLACLGGAGCRRTAEENAVSGSQPKGVAVELQRHAGAHIERECLEDRRLQRIRHVAAVRGDTHQRHAGNRRRGGVHQPQKTAVGRRAGNDLIHGADERVEQRRCREQGRGERKQERARQLLQREIEVDFFGRRRRPREQVGKPSRIAGCDRADIEPRSLKLREEAHEIAPHWMIYFYSASGRAGNASRTQLIRRRYCPAR